MVQVGPTGRLLTEREPEAKEGATPLTGRRAWTSSGLAGLPPREVARLELLRGQPVLDDLIPGLLAGLVPPDPPSRAMAPAPPEHDPPPARLSTVAVEDREIGEVGGGRILVGSTCRHTASRALGMHPAPGDSSGRVLARACCPSDGSLGSPLDIQSVGGQTRESKPLISHSYAPRPQPRRYRSDSRLYNSTGRGVARTTRRDGPVRQEQGRGGRETGCAQPGGPDRGWPPAARPRKRGGYEGSLT